MKIKCLTLLIAGLAVSGSGLDAQGMRAEFILGASRSDFRSESWYVPYPGGPSSERWEASRAGSLLRPVLGVGASAQLAGPLWARAEAVAVTRGYSEPTLSRRSLYLEVPLLLEVMLPWRNGVSLRALAGVAPSTEVSCSADVELPYGGMRWIGPPVQMPVECGEERERNDIGRVYGAGFAAFEVGGFDITPELRMVRGRMHGGGANASGEPSEGAVRSRYRTWSLMVSVSR
jgi:hypothetical protein